MRYIYLFLIFFVVAGCSAIIDADASRFGDGGVHDAGNDAGPWTCDTECDDGIACTRNLCVDGTCQNPPDDSLCDNGFVCVPAAGGTGCVPEHCDLDCSSPPGCPGDSCYDCATPGVCNNTGTECVFALRDEDGDGYYAATVGALDCTDLHPPGMTDCNDDPNNNGALQNPGLAEACNGLDSNCDGQVDWTVATNLGCEGRYCNNPIPVVLGNNRQFVHQARLQDYYIDMPALSNTFLNKPCTNLSGNGFDVHYALTVNAVVDLEIEARGAGGADVDVVLAVSRTQGCSRLAENFAFCHDDIIWGIAGYRHSRIMLRAFGPASLPGSRTLYIVVKGYSNLAVGDIELRVTARSPGVGAMCSDAPDVTDLTEGGLLISRVSTDNTTAGEGDCDENGYSLVTKFSPPTQVTGTGTFTANTVSTDSSPSLYMRAIQCSNGYQIACDGPNGSDQPRVITYGMSNPQLEPTNYVIVGAINTHHETVLIQHELPLPPPPSIIMSLDK